MRFEDTSLDRRGFLRGASLLFAAPTVLGLAACSNGSQNNANTTEEKTPASDDATSAYDVETTEIEGFDGTLIVGFDEEFPPYGYVDDDGEYAGFDLDLAEAVCIANGWEYEPTPISWDAKDALLGSGQITCIWNGFTIEGREDDYTFTDPYMENRQVIVVAKGSNIATLADLAGKRVVTQADSAALELLSSGGDQAELGATFASLDTIGEYNTAFMMLEQGSYDAIAVDYPVAAFNIAGKEDVFVIMDEALNSEHYGVGFSKTDTGKALAEAVQKTLQDFDKAGTIELFCEQYADQGISYDLWCLPKA